MINPRDYRDTTVMILVCSEAIASTIFLYMHPAPVNFATWAGLVATTGGIFHWLTISDDKRVDAGNLAAVLPDTGYDAAAEDRNWKDDN